MPPVSERGHKESHYNRLSICWAEELLTITDQHPAIAA